MGLVMERHSRYWSSKHFVINIYLIDLSPNSSTDVKTCYRVSECGSALSKRLVFSTEEQSSSSYPVTWGDMNFEALSIVYNENGGVYAYDNIIQMVVLNDNGYPSYTNNEFVFLQYDASNQHVSTSTTTKPD